MTDAKNYVAVFRAAAKGVMESYPPPQMAPPGTGMMTQEPYRDEENQARSMAGVFNSIADVFQQVVDADGE